MDEEAQRPRNRREGHGTAQQEDGAAGVRRLAPEIRVIDGWGEKARRHAQVEADEGRLQELEEGARQLEKVQIHLPLLQREVGRPEDLGGLHGHEDGPQEGSH